LEGYSDRGSVVRSDGITVNWFVDHSWLIFALVIATALGVEAIVKVRRYMAGRLDQGRGAAIFEIVLLGVSSLGIGWQSVAGLLAR
jgi:hypothetical protein